MHGSGSNLAIVQIRPDFGDNVVQQITPQVSMAYIIDIYFSGSQVCGFVEIQLIVAGSAGQGSYLQVHFGSLAMFPSWTGPVWGTVFSL